ncbi:hypothetical protein H5410_001894 [Solanum commersonii]|uniref:Uncharacterized protein n=1 Tax=Solanum commersonii TaxID=4109 RepID=A0A9J6B0F9_SOLCO|nr:hypothetical protein H5410_001894 [Solanum commersonii]
MERRACQIYCHSVAEESCVNTPILLYPPFQQKLLANHLLPPGSVFTACSSLAERNKIWVLLSCIIFNPSATSHSLTMQFLIASYSFFQTGLSCFLWYFAMASSSLLSFVFRTALSFFSLSRWSIGNNPSTSQVLVLNEVDKLSREAQHSLRRTMEKYSASCRLILCSNSSSKVTEAVRSRCLNVRINAPMEEEVSAIQLSHC